eukprot:357254-Chlamydomonas_euryale.AAC.2
MTACLRACTLVCMPVRMCRLPSTKFRIQAQTHTACPHWSMPALDLTREQKRRKKQGEGGPRGMRVQRKGQGWRGAGKQDLARRGDVEAPHRVPPHHPPPLFHTLSSRSIASTARRLSSLALLASRYAESYRRCVASASERSRAAWSSAWIAAMLALLLNTISCEAVPWAGGRVCGGEKEWEGVGGAARHSSGQVDESVLALLLNTISCGAVAQCVGEWPVRVGRGRGGASAIRGCHEEGSGGATTFWDVLKLPAHTKLIPWPEIRAAAAERALDRQAWRDAIENLAPLEFKKPQQVGHMTRSCARRGGSG